MPGRFTVPEGEHKAVISCVVGHSESGHHHVLESETVFAQIVAANGDLYVSLDAPTPLRHRKDHLQHRELIVPPGTWRVIKKAEFDVRSVPPSPPDPPIRPQRILDPPHDPAAARRSMRPVRD